MADSDNTVYFGTAEESVASTAAWKATIAEFIGTLLFVFIGCGSVVATGALLVGGVADISQAMAVAVTHGIALAVVISSTSVVSGGHINPAVTFGIVLSGKLSILRGLMYWIGQLLGAVVGAELLVLSTPSKYQGSLGSHALGADISWTSGLIIEIILTFMLVFTVFGTAVDKRGPAAIAPLAIGLSVLVGIVVGFPFTGGSMNPARSFGPALVSGTWANHWVYWVGPLIGAAIASLVYTWVFLPPSRPATRRVGQDDYVPVDAA